MIKKCDNCNNTLTLKQAYKSALTEGNKYTCPKCGAKYKATNSSLMLYILILIIPGAILGLLHRSDILSVWMIVFLFIVRPFMIKFEKT